MKENNSVVTYEKIGMTVIRMGEALAKKSKGISDISDIPAETKIKRGIIGTRAITAKYLKAGPIPSSDFIPSKNAEGWVITPFAFSMIEEISVPIAIS